MMTYPTFKRSFAEYEGQGGKASPYSSIHTHVDGSIHTPKTIRHLIKIFNRLEPLIYKAVGVQEARLNRYCRPNEQEFVERLAKMRNPNFKQINKAWFGKYNSDPSRLDKKRFSAINLTSLFTLGTIEFRFGEVWPRIHAGKIKAYIVLCLALSAYAANSSASRMKPLPIDHNPKYLMRSNLLHFGIIGPEFKNVRKHLLSNLEGNSAWKNPDK